MAVKLQEKKRPQTRLIIKSEDKTKGPDEDKKKKESLLLTTLKNDTKLKESNVNKYREFISLANIFLENFSENIYKTSIEMDINHPQGIDAWREFLDYPSVRAYIQSFKDEKIVSVADEGLSKGDKSAVGIKKVASSGKRVNNSHIVLIRVPEKVDFNEVDDTNDVKIGESNGDR